MSKYDSLKFLKKTKARYFYICENEKCRKEIKAGEFYYKESIGMVNAPRIKLKKFCYECGKELLKESNQKVEELIEPRTRVSSVGGKK